MTDITADSLCANNTISLTVPLPRRRLDGCACTSPIAHFYIYHSDSSIRELHPFTTTTHLASQKAITQPAEDDISIEFLFRKSGTPRTSTSAGPTTIQPGFASSFFTALSKLRRREQGSQWTERLAEFASQDPVLQHSAFGEADASSQNMPPVPFKIVPISLRLEGPYFTTADPARYQTVVCIVAGTGISGALAISGAFKELERQSAAPLNGKTTNVRPRCSTGSANTQAGSIVLSGTEKDRIWTRCIVIWSVREDQYIALPALKSKHRLSFYRPSSSPLTKATLLTNALAGSQCSGLEAQIHLTGNGRKRLSVGDALDDILKSGRESLRSTPPSTWVYISGPNAFIEGVELACKKRKDKGVEWYGAR